MLYGKDVKDVSFGAIFLRAGIFISQIDGDGLYSYEGKAHKKFALDLLINCVRTGVFSWTCHKKSIK